MGVVIITGASRGLGRATATHLARVGHTVVATMRDPALGVDLHGHGLTVARLDVTDEASITELVERVLGDHGRVDAIVNNAASVDFSPIEHITDDRARLAFDTNLFGSLRTIRAVLPAMRAQGDGLIVNVSSIGGRLAPFCTGLYAMTKHALEAASEILAMEVRPLGIRVAIVEPGFFRTRMVDDAPARLGLDPASPYADAERRIRLWFAQGKSTAGDPEQVAAAIAAILDDPSPPLRHPVGPDAPLYIDGRRRLSDEAWIGVGRRLSDEDFFAEFTTLFAPVPA